jgi:polyisoprenoid-binding protein YceI
MKRIVLSSIALAALGAAVLLAPEARSAPESATWNADPVHSVVLFKIKHMSASWTYGRFNDISGTVEAADDGTGVTGASFVVKTDSIDTHNEKRDAHLRNPDFFNAKQFPEITFKSTSAKPIDADTTELTGELSLHGQTKPLTLKVVRTGVGKNPQSGAALVGWESTFVVKRADFGIGAKFGDAMVGEDVTLTVAVEASKQ